MNDPKRLLEGSPSPLMVDLLAAGRDESPSPEVAQRALTAALFALGTGELVTQAAAATLPAQPAVAAVAKLSSASTVGGATGLTKAALLTPALAKWVGAGVIGLAAAGAAPRVLRWVDPAPHARETRPAAAPPRAALPARETRAPSVAPAMAAPEVTTPGVSAAPSEAKSAAPRAAAPRARKAAALPAPSRERAGLHPEIANIDRARERLQRGNPGEALRELARYESDFPERQLQLEVLMLRMEAYVQLGSTERARELAEQVLSTGPSPAHATRARAVLAKAGAQR
jgi:hypothetical protein